MVGADVTGLADMFVVGLVRRLAVSVEVDRILEVPGGEVVSDALL